MKKVLLCGLILGLSQSVFAAQEPFTSIPKTSTGNYITTIREAVNTNFGTQHTMNTELYAADALKADKTSFASQSAFANAWGWTPGGGGTWGSITGTLSSQTDLQAALDAKSNSTNISFVASSLSDLKYDPDTGVADDEYAIITNTGSVGDANAATVAPTLYRAGILFQSAIIQSSDCSTYITEGQLCVQY